MRSTHFTAILAAALIAVPFSVSAQITPDDVINQIIAELQAKNPMPQLTIPTIFVNGSTTVLSDPRQFTTSVLQNPVSTQRSAEPAATPPAAASSNLSAQQAAPAATTTDTSSAEEITQLKRLVTLLTEQVRILLARAAAAVPRVVSAAPAATSTAATSSATTAASEEEAAPGVYQLTRDLTLGSRGEDVRVLQQLLAAKNFYYGDITGYFGALTRTALRAFQTEYGLPVVGNVGPVTRTVLNNLLKDGVLENSIETPELFTAQAMSSMPINATTGTTTDPLASSTAASSTQTAVTGVSSSTGPVAVSLSLLPARIAPGGAVSLTWLSQNASSCEGSDGWSGPKPLLGAARVDPVPFTLNFVLTCTGPLGSASTSATVIVE